MVIDPHPRRHSHHKVKHATKQAQVKHLSDGRVIYRDDNGMFWFYMYVMHSNSASSPAYVSDNRSFNYYSTPTPVTSLPVGGAWVPATLLPTQTETQLEMALNDPRVEVAEVAIETDAGGGLIETNEVQTEFAYDAETNSLSSETAESNSESGSDMGSSDSGSSDSGSSDSGSSDSGSSGGDSGGGDSGGSSGD